MNTSGFGGEKSLGESVVRWSWESSSNAQDLRRPSTLVNGHVHAIKVEPDLFPLRVTLNQELKGFQILDGREKKRLSACALQLQRHARVLE